MGFLVSQHGQLGAIPPPPFLSVSPFESIREVEVRYPPPSKGYLSDTCAIPFENKANGCDIPLCDTISKGYCAIWGGISHWAAKFTAQNLHQTKKFTAKLCRGGHAKSLVHSGLDPFFREFRVFINSSRAVRGLVVSCYVGARQSLPVVRRMAWSQAAASASSTTMQKRRTPCPQAQHLRYAIRVPWSGPPESRLLYVFSGAQSTVAGVRLQPALLS